MLGFGTSKVPQYFQTPVKQLLPSGTHEATRMHRAGARLAWFWDIKSTAVLSNTGKAEEQI